MSLVSLLTGCPGDTSSSSTHSDTTSMVTEALTSDPTTTGETEDSGTTSADLTSGGSEGSGARLLYFIAGPTPSQRGALRAVDDTQPSGPSAPVTVLEPPDGGWLGDWSMAPDGGHMAVTAQAGDMSPRLFIIDCTTYGVAEVMLPAGLELLGEIVFSPDERTFTLRAASADQVTRLYLCSLSTEGTCTIDLWSPEPPAGALGASERRAFSADGERLAFSGDFSDQSTRQLLLGTVDIPEAAIELDAFDLVTSDVGFLQFSESGGVLYYSVDLTLNSAYEFFAIDLTTDPPGVPEQLSPPVATDIRGSLAPNLDALLWWTGEASRGDLAWIPVSGTTPGDAASLNADGLSRVFYNRWYWSPDSQRVAYLSDHVKGGSDELYIVEVGGPMPTAPVRINAPLGPGGFVDAMEFDAESKRIVYFAAEADAGTELFLADLTTPGTAVKVNAPLPPGGSLTSTHLLSPDGSMIVYQGFQDAADTRGLYIADVSGSQPGAPMDVTPPLPPGEMQGFFTPVFALDGARLYVHTPAVDNQRMVYRVGVNGASAPMQLSLPDENVDGIVVLAPTP